MNELYHSNEKPEGETYSLSLCGNIEALLFSSPTSLTVSQISSILDLPLLEVEKGLADLEKRYQDHSGSRGIRLQRDRDRITLTSAPEAAPYIERLMEIEISGFLSTAAMETLAIIAYNQPTTRPEIDSIRGVNSDGVIRNLQAKGLVNEVGRASTPGRPILYCTSAEFLEHFGISSLNDLPALNIDQLHQEADDQPGQFESHES